jgi:hypothetical protein
MEDYKATPLHILPICVNEELPKAKMDKEKFKLNLLRDGILFQLVLFVSYLFLNLSFMVRLIDVSAKVFSFYLL